MNGRMQYLYNAWYAAAWANEIGAALFARTLLDIPIVLFREGGTVVAMHDRCPHRFAPLSRGALVAGQIRCGYHGLSFDARGTCMRNLFSGTAPKAAKVRTFPTHEQDKIVWIWMGDRPPVGVERIPRLEFHSDEALGCVFGYTHARAHYLVLSDNLMDLTHTALLHPGFGGLDYIPAYKCWVEHDEIISQYIVDRMPSFIEPGQNKFLHNEDKIRWIAPGTHYLESRVTPEGEAQGTLLIPSAHILSPETSSTTHYFWSSAPFPGSGSSDAEARAAFVQAFDHEDKPMVEAVQQRMGTADLWDSNPVLLATDAGAVRVRRRLSELIEAERSHRSEMAAPAGR
jgi:phenylpropionate dioxygenase-like ring-hydroxylating dioxygenase large terminal subunit